MPSTFPKTRLEVRESAAEILAAIGPVRLRRVAQFRAKRWRQVATFTTNVTAAERARAKADEWARIARAADRS